MNAIQKVTFAVTALAITLVGAILVNAPLAFARPVAVTAHTECVNVECNGVTHDTGLVALNRK